MQNYSEQVKQSQEAWKWNISVSRLCMTLEKVQLAGHVNRFKSGKGRNEEQGWFIHITPWEEMNATVQRQLTYNSIALFLKTALCELRTTAIICLV